MPPDCWNACAGRSTGSGLAEDEPAPRYADPFQHPAGRLSSGSHLPRRATMLAIADVAVMVRSAQESARWWTEKVGFEVHTIGPPGGHAVMVAPPGDRFVLHLCEGFAPLEPGNTGIAFVTDEIEALVARMEAAGVVFSEPLRTQGLGGTAKFADPDGNIFWLIGAPTKFIREQSARRAGSSPATAPSARRHGPTSGRGARPGTHRRSARAR